MELYASLLALLSLVTLSACDVNTISIGSPGSYTDTLLNGIRRLENQSRRKSAVVGGRQLVSSSVVDQCYPRCPVGTVCSTDIGIRRCIRTPVVASTSFTTGYNNPLITSSTSFGSGYGDPTAAVEVVRSSYSDPATASMGLDFGYNGAILPVARDYDSGVVISGAANFGVVGFGPRNRFGFVNNGVRLIGCGIVPPDCLANKIIPGFLTGAVFKYTFDYTLNRCVRISVCSTCAFISGPQDNLFNNPVSCNQLCRQF